MGRFGNIWKSGKYTQNPKDEPLSKEVVSMMTDVSPAFGLSESSHVVLSALKPRRGMETGRWLNTLTNDLGAINERLTDVPQVEHDSAFGEMTTWMDKLFYQFRDLAFEFNKTAANTELLVTVEHPQLHDKVLDPHAEASGIKVYRGRLTTTEWALGVIGEEEKIAIHLIPAAMLLGFIVGQFTAEQYPPFMEVVRSTINGKPGWTIGGEPTVMEAIPFLAKELLGDLIRVASGVMSESELFSSGTGHPKLGENLAVGYANVNKTPEQIATSTGEQAIESKSISEACDVVDHAVDSELKKLYEQVAKLTPDAPLAGPTRTQISNLEKFRSKMLAAFEEYTNSHN
jgi:hypothetical protein